MGQEHVTTTLANAIRAGRIAHAYLFCGPRGTGKTTLARIFAKALNATNGPKVDFDDNDPRVKEIAEGRSLDVLEIDGASNNGVEQVRELRDTARFAPAAGKFKIYIIDEVHMLSTAAFNALLKTLEEPPAHVKFIFATTDPEKVLPTILSRCQRFDLRRIPTPLIVEHLGQIARQEKVELDDAALLAIARGADGGMRDAQSTLDQLISFCGGRIVESDVLSMFGLASRSQLLALTDAILGNQPSVALRLLDELARGGKDLGRLLSDVLAHFRNLLLLELSNGDRSLVEVTDAEWAALEQQKQQVDADALGRILDVLSAGEGRLREAPSKRIFLEVTLLKAVQAREAISLEAVLKQLKALREGGGEAPPTRLATAPAPRPPDPPAEKPKLITAADVPVTAVPAVSSAPVPPMTPPPSASVRLTPDTLWAAVYQSLARSERMLWTLLAGSSAVSWENSTLTVSCSPDALEFVTHSKTATLLRNKLRELSPGEATLKFVPGAAPVATTELAAPTPVSLKPSAPRTVESRPTKVEPVKLNKDDFLADPLIQEAMAVFKAQLIEVRAPAEG